MKVQLKQFIQYALIAIAVFSFISLIKLQSNFASSKLFWLDEYFEITRSCNPSLGSLLLEGGIGVSKSPLYFFLQKLNVLSATDYSDLTFDYRRVSLYSAWFMLLVMILYFSWRYKNILLALLILPMATNHWHLHRYAAENRPYMLWVFCFAIVALLGVQLSSEQWNKHKLFLKVLFFLCCAALAMAAAPGMLQALVFCVAVFFAQFLLFGKKEAFKSIPFLGIVSVFSLWLGFRYLTVNVSVAQEMTTVAHEYDLLHALSKGDLNLLKAVLRLLFPKGGMITLFMNSIAFFSFVFPIHYFLKRRSMSKEDQALCALFVVICSQLSAAVVLGFFTAIKHYFFVERIFLYLMPVHILLFVLGFLLLLKYIESYRPKMLTMVSIFLSVLFLTQFVFNLQKLRAGTAEWVNKDWTQARATENRACEIPAGKIIPFSSKLSSHLHVNLNAVVRLDADLKNCERPKSDKQIYLEINDANKEHDWFVVHQEAPAELESNEIRYFRHCGEAVVIE